MQTGARRDRDRRGRVPLVLAAGVGVDVGVAEHDRHRLRAGRPHRDQLGAQGRDEPLGLGRGTRATHHHAGPPTRRRRQRGRCGTGENQTARGQRDRPGGGLTVDDERDVHRPVGAGWLTELARAVEGIDDPDPGGVEARQVVRTFLREHRVVRVRVTQAAEQQLVRAEIAFAPDAVGRLALLDARPDAEQEPARLIGETCRVLVIRVARARHPIVAVIRARPPRATSRCGLRRNPAPHAAPRRCAVRAWALLRATAAHRRPP